MHTDKLITRLQELGVDVPRYTIKRWAFTEKVVPKPTKPVLAGRHHMSDWPDEALEEAAAVWWVREKYRTDDGKKKRLSKDQINVVKRAASVLDDGPLAVYTLPSILGPLSHQQIMPEKIEIKFVREDFEGLDQFPGENNAERAECLNKLVIAWIAAVEKVREWEFNGKWTYIMRHRPDLNDVRRAAEADFSQFDSWKEEVPCPWRIDKGALVELYWGSLPSNNKNETPQFKRLAFPFQRTLKESEFDRIILFENGIDTRELFQIDIGDRAGLVKAKLEKVESEIEENERKRRSLGMEDTNLGLLVLKGRGNFETLTAEEKPRFKTAQERLNLELRRARIRIQFKYWLSYPYSWHDPIKPTK